MKMGVTMIDGFGSRLDGLVDSAFDFYYRRMTLPPNRRRTVPAKDQKRTANLDPALRIPMFFLQFLIYSTVFHRRSLFICI